MATELVYDEAFNVMNDQIYLFGEQWHRTFRMLGKVDFIVTDSPLLMNIVYDKQNDDDFRKFIKSRIHKLKSLDFFVNRSNAFSEVGRIHNLEQSKELDKTINFTGILNLNSLFPILKFFLNTCRWSNIY